MIEYKEKRKVVDDLKDALQNMITEYTKLTEAGIFIRSLGFILKYNFYFLFQKYYRENH